MSTSNRRRELRFAVSTALLGAAPMLTGGCEPDVVTSNPGPVEVSDSSQGANGEDAKAEKEPLAVNPGPDKEPADDAKAEDTKAEDTKAGDTKADEKKPDGPPPGVSVNPGPETDPEPPPKPKPEIRVNTNRQVEPKPEPSPKPRVMVNPARQPPPKPKPSPTANPAPVDAPKK